MRLVHVDSVTSLTLLGSLLALTTRDPCSCSVWHTQKHSGRRRIQSMLQWKLLKEHSKWAWKIVAMITTPFSVETITNPICLRVTEMTNYILPLLLNDHRSLPVKRATFPRTSLLSNIIETLVNLNSKESHTIRPAIFVKRSHIFGTKCAEIPRAFTITMTRGPIKPDNRGTAARSQREFYNIPRFEVFIKN